MPRHKPIQSGDRFSRWTVIGFHGVANKDHHWLCVCNCGNSAVVSSGNLRSGRSSSCGCRRVEVSQAQAGSNLRHGESGQSATGEYRAWLAMLRRCLTPTAGNYANYGAKGVKVCERWLTYENFLADMGHKPSSEYSLDRYPDQRGDYEPSNCRWATAIEQQRNKTNNTLVTIEGKTRCAAEWCAVTGLASSTFHNRVKRGWSGVELLRPPRQRATPTSGG